MSWTLECLPAVLQTGGLENAQKVSGPEMRQLPERYH